MPWADTVLEGRAAAGRALDVAAQDRNVVVVGWARDATETPRRQDLRCLNAALRRIEPIFPEVES